MSEQANGTAQEAGSDIDPNDAAIAAIEARRAERQASTQKARNAQYAIDVARVDELEEEHGAGRVRVLKTSSFVPNLPTLVVVKTPSELHFKRFRQQVRKANGDTEEIGAAKDLLASVCLAYPDEVTYARMKQSWPSIHDNVGQAAIQMGEAEGKG
jgi:hypothetical protein